MKKMFSLLIVLVILFTCATPAFAAKNCTCGNYPLVVVSGMNTFPTVIDKGKPTERQVWPPVFDAKSLVSKALKTVLTTKPQADYDYLADLLIPVARDLLEPMACNADGSSKYDVTVPQFSGSAKECPDMLGPERISEFSILREGVERLGASHVYFYNYSFRLDPIEHAKELNALIQKVKAETGHSKVNLVPCSMGGIQTMAYLAEYGSKDINTVAFLSSTFYGALAASDAFSKRIVIYKDLFTGTIPHYLPEEIKGIALPIIEELDRRGMIDVFTLFVNDLLSSIIDKVFDELMTDIFVTMPGFWALVQPEDYEACKKDLLDPVKHKKLIKRIDYMHENVNMKREKILKDTLKSGTKVFVFTHYNGSGFPVYESSLKMGDGLVECYNSSGGAYLADANETLPKGYKQAKTACGHNHLSKDRIVDASTCVLPEYTWFFKNTPHVGCYLGDEQSAFLFKLLSMKQQPSVQTKGLYPQFVEVVDGKLIAL